MSRAPLGLPVKDGPQRLFQRRRARRLPAQRRRARRLPAQRRRARRLRARLALAFQPLFRSTRQVLARYSTVELELLTGFLRQFGAATEQLIYDMRAAQGPAA